MCRSRGDARRASEALPTHRPAHPWFRKTQLVGGRGWSKEDGEKGQVDFVGLVRGLLNWGRVGRSLSKSRSSRGADRPRDGLAHKGVAAPCRHLLGDPWLNFVEEVDESGQRVFSSANKGAGADDVSGPRNELFWLQSLLKYFQSIAL